MGKISLMFVLSVVLIPFMTAKSLQTEINMTRLCSHDKNDGTYEKVQFSKYSQLLLLYNFGQVSQFIREDYKKSTKQQKEQKGLLQVHQVYIQCRFSLINYQIIFNTQLSRYYYLVYTQPKTNTIIVIDKGIWSIHFYQNDEQLRDQ